MEQSATRSYRRPEAESLLLCSTAVVQSPHAGKTPEQCCGGRLPGTIHSPEFPAEAMPLDSAGIATQFGTAFIHLEFEAYSLDTLV